MMVFEYAALESGLVPRRFEISPEVFQLEHAAACQPVLLCGIMKDWAWDKWEINAFKQKFGQVAFRCSHDASKVKRKIDMKFDDFMEYCSIQRDESPLYIFDKAIGTRTPEMLTMFSPPPHFPEDFLQVLGETKRPAYRCEGRLFFWRGEGRGKKWGRKCVCIVKKGGISLVMQEERGGKGFQSLMNNVE